MYVRIQIHTHTHVYVYIHMCMYIHISMKPLHVSHRIDADCSGAIEKHEFIRPLTRWINESKTAPRFVKYNMERALHQQDAACWVISWEVNGINACDTPKLG